MDTALSGSVPHHAGTSPAKPGEFGHAATHGTATHETGTTRPAPTARPRHCRPRDRPPPTPAPTTPTGRPRSRGRPGRPPGHAPAPGPLLAADQADRAILGAAAALMVVAAAADTAAGVDVQRHHRRAHRLGLGRVLEGRRAGGWSRCGGRRRNVRRGLWLAGRATERFLLRLRDHSFAHLQRLSPDFFARHSLGDLVRGALRRRRGHRVNGRLRPGPAGHLRPLGVLFLRRRGVRAAAGSRLVVVALLPLLLMATRRFSGGWARCPATNGPGTARSRPGSRRASPTSG